MQEVDYYSDPERYNAEYAFLSADTGWYRERAKEQGGPALVLGCGTGRVLFHLADAGLSVDGLDGSAAMLDFARSRAMSLGKPICELANFYEGNMRGFSLPHRYRVIIIPLNGLMHLHSEDDVLTCLMCIREHLAEDGRLIFDITNPKAEVLAAYSEPQGLPVRNIKVRSVTYQQRERHTYDQKTGISETVFTYLPQNIDSPSFSCRLRLRMFTPAEIARLLRLAEMTIIEKLGSFKNDPFDGSSLTQIIVARA
ncbi:MAG: class I SAM-dependent methyltransferase [Deltaproteobacteria bacterium]|nr:class I SAM-dependent methyltransferase [Deltaproteobacteria bacterium]MBW1873073.1 class I SAM-dependent methyltransferase [Deltaproteobacteria bacterium]